MPPKSQKTLRHEYWAGVAGVFMRSLFRTFVFLWLVTLVFQRFGSYYGWLVTVSLLWVRGQLGKALYDKESAKKMDEARLAAGYEKR